MLKIFKCFLSATVLISLCCFSALCVSAETVAENGDHKLSLTLPDGYLLLDSETAEDNLELIEGLGYSLSSFLNYLKPTNENTPQPLFLGVEPNTKAQISVKYWSTDFSKKIEDFSLLDDEALSKTAKELIQTKGSTYKTVSANGMKLIEVRSNTKDSGGNFCSVQYVTVCNKGFYSLNFTFAGNLSDEKVQSAWDTLTTFKIETDINKGVWDVGSILIIVLLGAGVIAAVVLAVVIIISIIKDIKNRRTDAAENSEYIERRR